MRRHHQRVGVAVALEERPSGRGGLRAVGAAHRAPAGLAALQRGVADVAREHRAFAFGRELDRHVARRVARREREGYLVVERVVVGHDVGLAGLDHREHAVVDAAVGIFLAALVDRDPVVVLGACEEVARVGEGRHPAPVHQPRVPAHVVGVEMGAHHEVDIVGREADGGEPVEVSRRRAVRPGRVEAALLVVADAGIDQDRPVPGPQHVGLHRHHQPVRGGVEEAGLEPGAVRGEGLLTRVRQQEEHVEIGLLGFDDPVPLDFAHRAALPHDRLPRRCPPRPRPTIAWAP